MMCATLARAVVAVVSGVGFFRVLVTIGAVGRVFGVSFVFWRIGWIGSVGWVLVFGVFGFVWLLLWCRRPGR